MVLFKTLPLRHQQAEFEAHRDDPFWGEFWEMGTGKSYELIMQASHLEETGKIDGMFVLAPNGVHRNWIVDQLPEHLPVELARRTKMHSWMSSKASTKWHAKAAKEVLDHKGFAICAMAYDAIMTKAGSDYAKKFLQKHKCIYICDESPKIKTPGAKRTIRVLASGAYAPYRRIATGTLVADKPFDVYTQIKFLNPDAWKEIGCSTFEAFKATFGVWRKQQIPTGRQNDDGTPVMREFPMLVEYRNLELLKNIVAKYGSRLRKEDVLDLPPKLYSKRYFEMTPAQWRVYEDLRRDYYTFLDSGEMVESALAITRMLRFQQITSGYLPTEDDTEPFHLLCQPNPRVQLLREVIEEAGHQVIVWAKYQQDITQILAALRADEVSCVRYDGLCSETEMNASVDTFKAGKAQVFVGNPEKGSEGLTLIGAKSMVYYNNTFKLDKRLQSEDRNHRIGQDVAVNIIDLAAVDTIDNAIIDALRRKYELASLVQGDQLRTWI